MARIATTPSGLVERVRELFPDSEVIRVEALSPDAGAAAEAGQTEKSDGYGLPLKITLRSAGGERVVTFRTATANEFGHDRRSDRAQAMLLDYDTFGTIPHHVQAVDVGAIGPEGRLLPLRGAGELYLITTYAEGAPYSEDLRRIAAAGVASPLDLERCDALATMTARLHRTRLEYPGGYRRAIRDLVGHGEGIFGIVDGYPDGTPAAPPERLRRLEELCLGWRWRLRGRAERLARIHGDFHPFNVIFREGARFTLLDASRGCAGEPADDLTAMAINYPFFALDQPGAWAQGLRPLWYRFWRAYLDARPDADLLSAAPPFFAWRALVVCNPRFYPRLSEGARDRMLGLAASVLESPALELDAVEALFS